MASKQRSHPQKYRMTDRQPFFLWLVLLGLLLQVDHLRRVSSSQSSDNTSITTSPTRNTRSSTIAAAKTGPAPVVSRYKVPNVLLAGVQKAGTNSVASWIYRHKNVCKPHDLQSGKSVNGVHFFNTDDRYLKEGIDSYGRHFQHCTPKSQSIVMDATPDYLPLADRIRETYDLLDGPYAANLKIIMIVREPVEREFSWYNHQVALSEKEGCPRQIVKKVRLEDGSVRNFQSYLDNMVLPDIDNSYGKYAKWLHKWVENFHRNQILLISFEELSNNPKSVMNRIETFLGLKKDPDQDLRQIVNLSTKGGVSKRPMMPCQTQENFAKEFKESNKEFYKFMEAHQGPPQQQKPFPKFKMSKCKQQDVGNKPGKQESSQQQGLRGDSQGQSKQS